MEIRNLSTYIKVCENKSFSKAAAELGYAQSTVTAQINQLEQELNVSLFDRNGKHFQLNAKGRELLDYANRLVSLSEEAKSTLSDKTPRGLLRIGVIESVGAFFLPEILLNYLKTYPLVQVQVRTATTLEIMDMLRKNQIDLMLTLDEKLYDEDWHCPWEKKEEILFLCSTNHPFSENIKIVNTPSALSIESNVRDSDSQKELSSNAVLQEVALLKNIPRVIPLQEVVSENMILTEKRCNYRQAFEHILNTRNLKLSSTLEIGCTNTILNFTAQNVGISFLPSLTARKALAQKKLSTFKIKDVELQMYIQLIHRKSKWCSPAMSAFIQVVKNLERV